MGIFSKKSKYIPKFPGLNRSPDHIENDPRKARLMAMPQAVLPKPIEMFSYWAVQHIAQLEYYQDGLGSCVAESGSRGIGILSYKENSIFVKPSTMALMAYIKSRVENDQGYGATLESCPKAVKNYGVPLEDDYKSDYTKSWEEFIDDQYISQEVEDKGTKQKIKQYAWTDQKDLESYKVGIAFGEGNVVHGGIVGSSEGWSNGNVRIPRLGEKTWGHGILFFGYDNDNIYFTNSWSWRWGLVLYLKLVEDEFGKYYIKGSSSNYDIIIKGVGALGKDYESVNINNDPYLFRGFTYIDLPDELALKTQMLKVIKTNAKKDQIVLKNASEGYIIPEGETRQFMIDLGIIANEAPGIVTDAEMASINILGKFPSKKLMDILEPIVKDIYLPE